MPSVSRHLVTCDFAAHGNPRALSSASFGRASTTRWRNDAMDMKLELVPVPVTDVDRARDFYVRAGFVLDHDHRVNENLRFVQLTPPGSACSIALGEGITEMTPGSIKGLQMVVADARAARDDLRQRGIDVSEVEDLPWGKFVYFSDPDGNSWALQQIPPRPAQV
jgi:catechol 2,3-dioxygenase-like lactoylglutathione lyase family enzyme